MKDILSELIKNGYEAYIVGGYVRDLLLEKDSNDIDICTNATIEDIKKIFKNRGEINEKYFTYHIKDSKYNYDITSYRKELEYSKNKPIKIAYTKSLKEDLKRRDFTVNGLLLSIDDKIIDKVGGKKDIKNKLIKTIGPTYKKLNEDKTRIIRAIRLSVTLNFELDKKIKSFLKTRAHLLNEIPHEYKKKEIDKMLDSEYYYNFLTLVKTYDLEKYLGIYFNETKPSYDKMGLYAQMNSENLPFTKKEKKIIHNIRLILDKKDITYNDIIKYDETVLLNAAYILKKTNKLKKLKEINSLHSNLDIDIDINTMLEYIDIKDVKKVYKDIENMIINNEIKNKKEIIEKYLKERV